MVSVILISTAALLVAIVGCAVIWRMDALRADEIEHTPPPEPKQPGGPNGSLPASPRSS
ncbi:hypothetical protein IEZ26_06025 [Nocardioides cavernae]|uniref:Uncharacterized protein n=1 Tax=Nocardioides cavernae TaxID=1921566 RepID=A0ABR8NAC1_9ACTN|nr:hypothetical protein [Nocardioides cavernae]MBD3924171.1 hypothetical protein [Nocardioides cavernae]MBM7510891.1 hypothetical protein [Nocardioides cavernae]